MFTKCQHFSKFSSIENICQCSVFLTVNSSGSIIHSICMGMCACVFDVKTEISYLSPKCIKSNYMSVVYN